MYVEPFFVHLQITGNRISETANAYRSDLALFGAFLRGRATTEIAQVDQPLINAYVECLRGIEDHRSADSGLADSLVDRRLTAISYYLEYLRANTEPQLRKPIREFY
jgi:site-specific recombinase XerD